jgi:hypothetical protein
VGPKESTGSVSDFAVFWIAIFGSVAYEARARTRDPDDRFDVVFGVFDRIVSLVAFSVACVYFVKGMT